MKDIFIRDINNLNIYKQMNGFFQCAISVQWNVNPFFK